MGKVLILTDISGNKEALTDFKGLKRQRGVNGEKSISFMSFLTLNSIHAFPLVQEQSIVELDGEPYVIKRLNKKPIGATYYKEVTCIHKFFDDMRNKQMYTSFTKSFTFNDILTEVFRNTGYNFQIEGTFAAQQWDNFGKKNRLALFQDVLSRYQSEFEIDGNLIRLKKKVGRSSIDFQLRYNHNIKTLNEEVNTNNLATYIKGYGKRDDKGNPIITAEYTSPNANIFGKIEAQPIDDERYTTQTGLEDALVEALIDEPEVSITVDFVDLRKVGYPYEIPSEGDEVYLIHEPMGINLKVRIMQIDEELDANLEVVRTSITLANLRKSAIDVLFDANKSIRDIIDGNGNVKYSVLDDAVKRATEALKSAETELTFENGIIARSKIDPNFLVLLNSAGLGISNDGGQTFKEAITGEGFVLSAGAIGRLKADNISVGVDTFFEEGYDPIAMKQAIDTEIEELQTVYSDLNLYLEDAFKDGIISETESKRIEGLLKQLEIEKADMEIVYNELVNNADMTIVRRTNLTTDYNEFETAYDEVVREITATIIDGIANPNEILSLSYDLTDYGNKIKVLHQEFQKSNDAIAQKKADNVGTKVRDDLRLAAPLPNYITLNADGIKAQAVGDPTRYATLDYRGLYVKNGALWLEGEDGRVWVQNGIIRNSLIVQQTSPAFLGDNIDIQGRYYRSFQSDYDFIGAYQMNHEGRYLVVEGYALVNSAGVQVAVQSYAGLGFYQTMTILKDVNASEGKGFRMVLDLGKPTYAPSSFYIKMRSDNAPAETRCRINWVTQYG